MKAYRSALDEGTLILRPQDEMDGKVIDYIEKVLADSIVRETEHYFHFEETTLVIRTTPAGDYDWPSEWPPWKPDPTFINGVCCS